MNTALTWLSMTLALVAASAADSKSVSVSQIVGMESLSSIRVICTPEDQLVRLALTPERLLANYESSFELERSAPSWSKFEHSAQQTTLEDSGDRGDHRWAILFRNPSGQTEHVLAIDRKRRLANFDGKAYRIRGELLSWLKAQRKLLVKRR
jgi:hypothetical protein